MNVTATDCAGGPGVTFYAATSSDTGPVLTSNCGAHGYADALMPFGPFEIAPDPFSTETEFLAALAVPSPFAILALTGPQPFILEQDAPLAVAYDANGSRVDFCNGPIVIANPVPGACWTALGGGEYQYTLTGNISYVAVVDNVTAINSLTFDPPAVNEPGTFWLFVLGVILVVVGAHLAHRTTPKAGAAPRSPRTPPP